MSEQKEATAPARLQSGGNIGDMATAAHAIEFWSEHFDYVNSNPHAAGDFAEIARILRNPCEEIARLRGEMSVIGELINAALDVMQTVDVDDSDEERQLMRLRFKLAGAVDHCRNYGGSANTALASLQPVQRQVSDELATANAEIARLRALLEQSDEDATHQCRKCLLRYTPAGSNEDCPTCDYDAAARSLAQPEESMHISGDVHRDAGEAIHVDGVALGDVWAKQYDDGTWAACRGDEVITAPTYPTAEAAIAAAGVPGTDGGKAND